MDMLTLARSFASLLLDTAAKGTVLLLLACLAAWLCRRSSAALRHSIWCLTMGGLLLLPVASWALPAWQIPILPVAEVVRLSPTPPVAEVVRLPTPPPEGATGEGFDSPVLRHSTTGATVLGRGRVKDTGGPERPPVAPGVPLVAERASTPVPAIVEPTAPALTALEWTSLLVSAGWLWGVALFGCLLLVGLRRTVQLRRTSLVVSDGEWPGMLVELRQRLGLYRSVELREHAQSVVPLTWGIWRPVVLLPKLARAWNEPMRRAVLLHELAHVQRGDVACQVLGRLTCVLYWFHPLAWFALRQLRQEREQACDDAVVQTGEKASDYAEQLLEVARLCCAPRGLSLGVAMAEGSSIERRILSLFDSARSHDPLTRRVAIVSVLVGIAILCGLAPIQPTASEPKPVLNQKAESEDKISKDSLTSAVPPATLVDPKAATEDHVIQGTVVDARDQPVAGATIWCDVDYDKAASKPITARVESDAKGEFRFTVPMAALNYGINYSVGHWQGTVWSWKQGQGIGAGFAVASTQMPKLSLVRVVLPDTSPIALRVVDEQDQPLTGADVTVKYMQIAYGGMPVDGPTSGTVGYPPEELRKIATRQTDADGRVALDLVSRRLLSSVKVTSTSHGVQTFSDFEEVLKHGAVTSIEGELSTHQAGLKLSLSNRSPGFGANVQVVTDAQGKFSVPRFPTGPYKVSSDELNGPQFLKASSLKGTLVAGPVNQVTLEVITGIPVKGRVTVRGEKLGVKNAVVNVSTYFEMESGPVYTVYRKTDENGEYTSYTLPGHYTYPSLSSVGDDSTLVHPQIGGGPVSFQKPNINPPDAKEVVLPEIAVERGQFWQGKLVDEKDVPIDGVFIMPMLRGKQLFMPFPTQQGGIFGFLLLKGVTPDAWMVLTDVQDDSVPPLPTKIVSKNPLVLRAKRVAPTERDPDQPSNSWSPYGPDQLMNNLTAEEIEESQAVSSGFPELLKQAGLTEEELAHFNKQAPGELSGIVLDAVTRQPVAGVVLDLGYFGPKKNISPTTDKGLFRIQGIDPEEKLIAVVKKDGYAQRLIECRGREFGRVILLDSQTYFEGTITDAAGKPVADANLQASWEVEFLDSSWATLTTETRSKADGTYRLYVASLMQNSSSTIEQTGYDIQASAPGRGVARSSGNFIVRGNPVTLPLKLEPGVRFEARVVDSETGAVVPGYVLYTQENPFLMTRSDAEGRLFLKDLSPGLIMFGTGEGEGKEVPDCAACAGAKIYENSQYSRWWSPDVRTDEKGRWGQLDVPEGDKLQGNFNPMYFNMKPGMPPATIFVEKSATISGRVTDPDGKPVEGATVAPARKGGSLAGDTRFSVKTDKDGRYVMHIPASKNTKYNVLAHDGEYDTWRNWANGVTEPIQTTPGQTIENFDVQLTRPGSVKGRVLRNGKPVANYIVRTVACDRREQSYYNPAVKTKADGTFEIKYVRPGKHFLQVGFIQYSRKNDQGQVIEVVAGEVIADQELEAQKQPDPEEGVVPEPTPAEEAPADPEKEPTDATSKAEPTPAAGETPAVPPVARVDAQPAFTEFVVNIQPFEAPRNGYIEQLKFLADGKCWYKVEGREAALNLPARNGAVFDHTLSQERVRKLNQLLSDTQWLTAEDGAQGNPPGLHATTYRLTLKRDGGEKSIVWVERGPEPYRSLLHFLEGIAAQERRIYLHDHLSGPEGIEAWQEIGRELAALRGEPYSKSPYEIDYTRYLPIAVRIVRDFAGKPDEELLTPIRLIGHLKVQTELEFIQRLAHDRSSAVRQEVAWTLGQMHDPTSLPVLQAMMSDSGTRWEVGFELIQWGDDAVPGIVKLIELSTKDGLGESDRVRGEDMIRAYLEYWDKVPQPIHPDVITAVKNALEAADPLKSVRTTYHKEFLKKIAARQRRNQNQQ